MPMITLATLGVIMVGGGAGVGCRFLLSQALNAIAPATFPLGVFGVNAIGSLLGGILVGAAEWRQLTENWRLFLGVGFLGGFTTFSAFTVETANFITQAKYFAAIGNVVVQNGVGLALVFGGILLGHKIFGT
jgi:CrcB protein